MKDSAQFFHDVQYVCWVGFVSCSLWFPIPVSRFDRFEDDSDNTNDRDVEGKDLL